MSDSGIVHPLMDTDLPMCPNGMMRPIHPAHAVRVAMIDAAYEESGEYENEDGELPPPLEKVLVALCYVESPADRMKLYFDRVRFLEGTKYITIESWYFRCSICGLMLPAQRMSA